MNLRAKSQLIPNDQPVVRNCFLTLFGLIVVAAGTHFPLFHLRGWEGVIFLTVLIAAIGVRETWLLHTALLFSTIEALRLLPGLSDMLLGLPVLPLLVPLVIATAFVWIWPFTRPTLSWMSPGEIDAPSWFLVGVTGVGSAAALIVWAIWTDNLGMAQQMMADMAGISPWILALIGLPLFALSNAIVEEAVYRGVFQSALAAVSPWFQLTNIVQAAAFAALHFEMGFPNGFVGYGMVFFYGLLLGYLRQRTGGMAAPVITHVTADMVIGSILLVGTSTV